MQKNRRLPLFALTVLL